MRLIRNRVALLAALPLALLLGCASQPSYDQMRPDPSSVVAGDHGLQSKDLIEMSDKMAPSILKIPEIAQNPNQVVIVMTGIENHLSSSPGEDLTIYLARMKGLLNKNARDRLTFVEPRQTTERLQAQEGAGGGDPFGEASRGGGSAPTRWVPQYALKGIFYDKVNGQTTYYLCTFQLTNINTGQQVWEDTYEVRTGNY
jgi:PBP1b-binding outer membrane lipoprotein LpoB